jgi:iron complex transport system ATP-binding protein
MIEVRDLSFQFNGKAILQRIGLEAQPGEVTVLLGPNGSGKTTLMHCICAQNRLQSGKILLVGQPLADLSPRVQAQLLAIVPQDHHPVFPYTVREVILLGRLSRVGFWSQPQEKDRQTVEEILELLDINHLADKPYTQISGGERQLVLIGRCLAQEPQVLLLDEPTNHLDFRNKNLILKLVKDLTRQRRLTVLVTLHDPNLALLFADQVIMMNSGRVVAQGKPDKVIHPNTLSQLYDMEVEMLSQGSRRLFYPKLS